MNNRLYVGNLSYDATTDSLRSAFAECGEVGDVKIITDRETGRARGFAFVTMSNEAEATKAVERMNNSMLDGRALRVNIAEERGASRSDGPRRGGHRGW
jgi:RNA recognition motif-containing protein